MLKSLTDKKFSLFWLVFHIALGLISTLSPIPVIVWFYFVLLYSTYWLIKDKGNKFYWLLFIFIYLASFEVVSRISDCSPYIPYELGKYISFMVCTIGIILGFRKGVFGWFLVILLLPSFLIDESGLANIKSIVFNLLGPINVALAIIFLRHQEVSKEEFISFLKLILFPAISLIAYVFIKTPNLNTIEFRLGSNFVTSGGFGANQISTILGLGAFLSFLSWRKKWDITGFHWLDLVLFMIFAFRGLLTFSRGGMLGGFLGILVLLAFEAPQVYPNRFSGNVFRVLKIVLVLLMVFITFKMVDSITGGMLKLRYKGETTGTLSGTKQRTLNTFTSNRLAIFQDDIQLWEEYPLLGVGVGASRYMRESSSGFLSHVEMSRLLAEHGIPGLLYIILFFSLGYKLLRYGRNEVVGVVLIAFFFIAVFTTFHSAMRTYISPLLIGLSMLNVTNSQE